MTRVKEIEIAKSRLEQSGIKISGCILNAVEKKVGSAYNNNFYHYEYKSDDDDDESQPITTN
jgi:tyrosine-protein kinase Etk/Wzc